MGFVANFILFQQCKNFENWLRFDKVIESLKVGTFFWDTVYVGRTISCFGSKLSIKQQLLNVCFGKCLLLFIKGNIQNFIFFTLFISWSLNDLHVRTLHHDKITTSLVLTALDGCCPCGRRKNETCFYLLVDACRAP